MNFHNHNNFIRIAAIQIEYLPAYYTDEQDCLCYPIEKSLSVGLEAQNQSISDWREDLRETYCDLFCRKLERIINVCVQQECDLIVFPEYSIPIECLDLIRELSNKHSIAILAGTHRADIRHHRYSEYLHDKMNQIRDGKAIAPLFINGNTETVTKINGSIYDRDVEIDEEKEKILTEENITSLSELGINIFICIDYLKNRKKINQDYLIDVIISYTPAIGEFATQIFDDGISITSQEEVLQTIKGAYNNQKSISYHTTVFVNNAKKGGTKIFFNNRNPNQSNMESHDGTYGKCVINNNRISECGIMGGNEGIVIADISNDPTNPKHKQHAIIPIVHCTGPDDKPVNDFIGFLNDYKTNLNIVEKRSFIKNHEQILSDIAKSLKNKILVDKIEHILAFYKSIKDENLLDLLVCTNCIIHEDTPSFSEWNHRSCLSTISILNSVQNRQQERQESIEEAITKCKGIILKNSNNREVRASKEHDSKIGLSQKATDYIKTSSVFRKGVINCRSDSASLRYALRMIIHLLEDNQLKDSIRIIDQLESIRSYFNFEIINEIKLSLQESEPNIHEIVDYCVNFLKQHEKEIQNFKEISAQYTKDQNGNILAYGYSDFSFRFLESISNNTPNIIISECRNRSHIDAGCSFALKVSSLKFPVTYISDASISRVLSNKDSKIKTVLMGFNFAGPEGIINTIGSLGASILAKNNDIKVIFVGPHYKIILNNHVKWNNLKKKAIEAHHDALWINESMWQKLEIEGIRVDDARSDLVPWNLVDKVITDKGVYSSKELQESFLK